MNDREDSQIGGVSPALHPDHDGYVDDAVALGRGDLPRAEARRVRERMLADAEYRAVVEPIVRAYEQPPLTGMEAEKKWSAFVRAADLPETVARAAVGTEVERERRRRMGMLRVAGAIAAGIVLIVGGVQGARWAAGPAGYETVRTSATETVIRTLPDGTIATIGPSSQLRYPKRMLDESTDTRTKRMAWPSGEVTFQVARVEPRSGVGVKGGATFMVETPHAWIEVIGTKFTVLVLPGSTHLEVEEGVVAARKRPYGSSEPAPPRLELKAPASARFTTGSYSADSLQRRTQP